jgi:hypothetical protein
MYLFIFIIIIVFAAIAFIAFRKPREQQKSNFEKQSMHFDMLDDNGDTIKNIPEKLMNLTTTTVAQRQRVYKRGFQKQLQFDELQRRAEASGDTATLEAIRLGTYNGPLPQLKEGEPTLAMSHPDAPVQKLKYFCIKDKGYHVTVWPNNVSQFDIVEFNIAGMSHRDNIDDYIGEFKGTLEAEPNNSYDHNAIKVLAPDGHHLGYVPADMTDEIRDNTTLPCACFCYIGENDETYFSDCYIHRTT